MLYLALGLAIRGGERAENGQHRVQVGETGAETVDEVAEGEVSFEQVFVVVVDVVSQLAHERGVHLLELAQSFLAGFEDRLVPSLPAFELGGLAGALFAVDLEQFTRDFKLLALHVELLALDLERLALQVGQEVEQKNRVVGVGNRTGGFCPVGETSMR